MSQHTSVSMDGTDPVGWDPKLDSLTAAPANHRLLYEDESISRSLGQHRAGRYGKSPSSSLAIGVRDQLDALEDARLQR